FMIPRGDRGATGPANVLTVGEVVTGMPGTDAAVAISGKSPAQKVAFTIPRGDKGDKGDASKVPGPTGKSAYEYAVEAGFTGTEDEFAEAQLPDTIGWSNIEGKPSTFPPASHSHAWSTITGKPSTFAPAKHTHATADITGLRDELDTLMAALTPTDWTDCKMRSGFAANQGNVPQVQKENGTVVMRRGITNTGLSKSGSFDVLEVPAGFRPEESKYIPTAGSSAAAVGMAVVAASGVVTVRTSSTLSPYCLFDSLVWRVSCPSKEAHMADTTLSAGTVTWTIANQIEGSTARGANGYVEFEASAVAAFHGGLTLLPSPQRAEMVDG